MDRISGKILADKHGIVAEKVLYRKSGDWFHVLDRFPGVLFDADGYLFFETSEAYNIFIRSNEAAGVKENKETNSLTIKNGISRFHGYIKFYENNFPDEIVHAEDYWEGSFQRVSVNRYERDAKARRACISHWGYKCSVCGFDFSEVYGEVGRGFIHVHHLTKISSVGAEYQLDAKNDLRPVCPNCHAMLHKKDPPFTIEALQEILRRNT